MSYPPGCTVIRSRLSLRWSVSSYVFSYFCYIYSYNHLNASALQGDLADCFYIVESGQVRITMKRSRVCKKNKKIKGFWGRNIYCGGFWYLMIFCLSLPDEKRPGGRGGGYRDMLPGPVFWGVGACHKQAQSCISLCCGERQVLGYISIQIQHVNRNPAWNYVWLFLCFSSNGC